MNKAIQKNKIQERRLHRVRAAVRGTQARPRLSVFRSNTNIYAQLIDDAQGVSVCAFSSAQLKKAAAGGSKSDQARQVGQKIAELAKLKGISAAIFDRGKYRYSGRVKQLAESVRASGLKI